MPTPPGLSPKDANQVLRAVIDDTTNRLRVDAVLSPDGHDLEINYVDDSIAIGDPATDNILHINNDGSLTVIANAGTNLNTSTLALENGGHLASIDSKLTDGQATMAGSIPVTIASNQTSTPYALQLDNTSTTNMTYIGKAAVGSLTSSAVWQIQKLDQTSGLIITWAGAAAFNQIWNNRTSLTYA